VKIVKDIDSALIKHLYQALINATGRARGWWVEQCAYGWLITNALWVLTPSGSPPPKSGLIHQFAHTHPYIVLSAAIAMIAILAVIFLVLFLVFWVASRHEHIMDILGTQRRTAFWTTVFILGLNWMDGGTSFPYKLVETLTQLVFVSAFYFCACKPPEKRERKTNLLPQS
jgi:hypothetical protein